jgi:hypothetical protein
MGGIHLQQPHEDRIRFGKVALSIKHFRIKGHEIDFDRKQALIAIEDSATLVQPTRAERGLRALQIIFVTPKQAKFACHTMPSRGRGLLLNLPRMRAP